MMFNLREKGICPFCPLNVISNLPQSNKNMIYHVQTKNERERERERESWFVLGLTTKSQPMASSL